MVLELNSPWYHEFDSLDVDSGWKNPVRDGTGESPLERYSMVQLGLRRLGREVLVSPDRTKEGLPVKIFVSCAADCLGVGDFGGLAEIEGLTYHDGGLVSVQHIREECGNFEKVV